jgi:capsule polysaccharide modification protein KpsS
MVFEKEQPAFFVNEVIAVYSSYAAYYVGLANNVKYITPMVTRTHDATHHYFVSDPFQLNINFNPNYKSDLPDNKYLLKAKNYLKEFETKSLKPNLMAFTGAKPKLSMSFIKSFYFFLKEYLNPPNKSDYINRYNYKTHINPIIFYLRYQIMKRYFKVDNPNLKKKYVFVPLHYQPEAATLVCAEKYEKQLFLLDSLAKSIPADTVIYVKEHYALLGHKQISFYKEIIKYPNIFLVNPWFDSHLLIKNAEAVVALTGTAGFEAVLYRKPVILLGRIFYENAPGIIQLEDIYGSYKKALASWRQPTREEIELYLAECFRTMYEGCVYTIVPEVFLTDNIKRVADSLLKQFVRLIN